MTGWILPCCLIVLALLSQEASAQQPDWPSGGPETRPWSYWWWMGSAVDEANLTREMELYRSAGLGGLHIIPIYGAKGWEDRYVEYLSPRWMDLLRHTATEARRLGLGIDMTTGTGWCFGGPNIGPREACGNLALETFVAAPGQLVEKRWEPASIHLVAAFGPDGGYVELTPLLDENGLLRWTAGPGPWRVYAVTQRPCRTPVKRAAPGGEGPMLNPFYGEAIRKYLERFSRAFQSYAGPLPRAMYHDSFEYEANWSPDFFQEFERRRGYPLQKEIAALAGAADEERVARVKSDYRETLSDLLLENFLAVWVAWCRRMGMTTRNQAHGSPGNLLDLYAAADIPETEMFHNDRNTLVSKLASSAAHVTGKRLVASETGTWLQEHFHETLADLKYLVDQLFVAGVNHIIYHGTCYSPAEAPWPGWLFYASTQLNPRNPIWRDLDVLNAYITRVQAVLQSSRPAHDVLLYWPIHDLWHRSEGLNLNLTVHRREWFEKQSFGLAAQRLWEKGYTFDYISDRLLALARVRGQAVDLPGGSYRAIAVPGCRHMPEETLEKLLALARAGGTVVFEGDLPRDVPGLARLEERRGRFRQLIAAIRLVAHGELREARVGKGRILVGDLLRALDRAGAEREPMADIGGLEFLRRAIPGGRYYLVVNRGPRRVEGWIPLATLSARVLLMEPMSGQTGLAASRRRADRTEVYLELEPGESVILRTGAHHGSHSPWSYWRVAGSSAALSGAWRVEPVEGGPELPAAFESTALASWTERGEQWQRFAGTARYRMEFDAPGPAEAWWLDLGQVRESARIRLNGKHLATLIAPPFRVLLRDLKSRGNQLEVEVTNLAANRIRDMDRRRVPWKLFRDINFVNINYRPFDASGWPVRESGLLGPVTLRPASRWRP